MKDFWESRYSTTDFVYGKQPNVFFADQISNIKPGKILLPCEGEGRNAVFAAQLGWEVDAIDLSENAREKALQFAKKTNVSMKYYIADVGEFNTTAEQYDVLGLVYAHFHEGMRRKIHAHLLRYLKPGGIVILEAFSKKQLGLNSGGPKDEALLYTNDLIKNDFIGLKKMILQELQITLDEGEYHSGRAQVVRFVGKKIV